MSSSVFTRQVASTAARRSLLGPGDVRMGTRMLLKASAANIFLGGADVSTDNGAEIPSGAAAAYMELRVANPQELYVVGSGTVYMIFEEIAAAY